MYRIGIDVGGTFTDLVAVDDTGRVTLAKTASTPADQSIGVIDGLTLLAEVVGRDLAGLLAETDRIVHGTTVATNSLLERKGARAGMLTTEGHRDVIEMREGLKEDRYNLRMPPPVPLVPRARRLGVRERMRWDGKVQTKLDQRSLDAAIAKLKQADVEAVAVCYLHAYRDGRHEQATKKAIARAMPGVYVSLSSEVLGQIKEYERFGTTTVNAYVGPALSRYLNRLAERLADAGYRRDVLIMQSHGGVTPIAESVRLAAGAVLSGPAGGIAGSRYCARLVSEGNLITFDMGGTSTDIALLDGGEPQLSGERMIAGSKLALPSIDIHTLGAGGGSIAHVDAGGILHVGPESAGADPGPACYGQGGTEATVTDACVALGIIDPDVFLGGRRHLDAKLASEALTQFGDPLGLDVEQAASAIYRLVTAEMGNAIRAVTVERGRDPRQFVMAAFGGALGIFAADIARRTGIRQVVVPAEAAVFSAFGLLGTDDVRALARSAPWAGGDASHVDQILKDLEQEAVQSLRDAGFPDDRIEVTKQGDFMFAGQLWELTLPIPHEGSVTTADLEAVQAVFPEHYEAEYGAGTAWPVPVVMMTARVVARGVTDKLEPTGRRDGGSGGGKADGARIGSRRIRRPFEDEVIEADAYDALRLTPDVRIAGPAVVEHPFTTIQVPAGCELRVDERGNYLMEVATA